MFHGAMYLGLRQSYDAERVCPARWSRVSTMTLDLPTRLRPHGSPLATSPTVARSQLFRRIGEPVLHYRRGVRRLRPSKRRHRTASPYGAKAVQRTGPCTDRRITIAATTQRSETPWYTIVNPEKLRTPALCFYPARIEVNIAHAIRVAGSADRLRPHVKTYKSPEIVKLLLRAGVSRFKCATVTEAEMLVETGAGDVMLAYPLIGPNAAAFATLCARNPGIRFSTLADSPEGVAELAEAAAEHDVSFEVLVDLNVGMNRTGVNPGADAQSLYRAIAAHSRLKPGGIHAYDGQIQIADPNERRAAATATAEAAHGVRQALEAEGLPVPRMVAGGTPTFPCHAETPDFELSPGTCFLHDLRSEERYPDLPFVPAALVVGRVISRPATGLVTLDIGCKAIAVDQEKPHGAILNLPGSEPVGQSEEHWVFRHAADAPPELGALMYVLPRHICPSVAHYNYATVIDEGGTVAERWPITARGRELSFDHRPGAVR